MDEHELRQTIIKDPLCVKDLVLSANAAKIMRFIIHEGSMNSCRLSGEIGISLQNASVKLKFLHSKGYLKREEVIAETGGIEYIYKSVV